MEKKFKRYGIFACFSIWALFMVNSVYGQFEYRETSGRVQKIATFDSGKLGVNIKGNNQLRFIGEEKGDYSCAWVIPGQIVRIHYDSYQFLINEGGNYCLFRVIEME